MVQEIRCAAQMPIVFSGLLNLGGIFPSGAKNDAMNESKQMTELRLGKLQFQSQNKLDDGQVEGYHGIGTSPLSSKLWSGKRQFLYKGSMSFLHSVVRRSFIILCFNSTAVFLQHSSTISCILCSIIYIVNMITLVFFC